jgi:hypothetical protein
VPRFDPSVDFRDPKSTQGGVHNIVHLNSISRSDRGLVVSFGRVLDVRTLRARRVKAPLGYLAGRFGFIRRLEAPTEAIGLNDRRPRSSHAVVTLTDEHPRTATVVFRGEGALVPNHNAVLEETLLIYNDTNQGRLVAYDCSSGRVQRSVAIPGSPSFARGLVALGDGLYGVGSQAPLAVHVIDLEREAVVSSALLHGLEQESVYAICALPSSFAVPGDDFALETPSRHRPILARPVTSGG